MKLIREVSLIFLIVMCHQVLSQDDDYADLFGGADEEEITTEASTTTTRPRTTTTRKTTTRTTTSRTTPRTKATVATPSSKSENRASSNTDWEEPEVSLSDAFLW